MCGARLQVGSIAHAPSHGKLAYSVDTVGFETYELKARAPRTAQDPFLPCSPPSPRPGPPKGNTRKVSLSCPFQVRDLSGEVDQSGAADVLIAPETEGSVEFGADDSTLFYITMDECGLIIFSLSHHDHHHTNCRLRFQPACSPVIASPCVRAAGGESRQ